MAIDEAISTRIQPSQPPKGANVAAWLSLAAAERGDRPAVILAGYDGTSTRSPVTFGEIELLTGRYAAGLSSMGILAGTRVLLMVRPGVDFVALMFALFRIGAVPVLIDPGMGVARLLECVRGVEPEAFIGVPIAQLVRVLRRGPFRSVKHVVTEGRKWGWGGVTLRDLAHTPANLPAMATSSGDTAAILFTSGSTGPAKGVVYTHGMFDAQIRAIQSHFGMMAGDVDLPGFAPFALFSIAMGMTVVFPDMDFSRPARVDPRKIVAAVQTHRPANATGSPAMWGRVSDYCIDRSITLPGLQRVLLFGAPISDRLLDRVRSVLGSNADVHTPYGATEALPVASISGAERTSLRHSALSSMVPDFATRSPLPVATSYGICVGPPVGDVSVRVIRITDEPIGRWSEAIILPHGEIGEIVVTGTGVTREYFRLAHANAAAKILDDGRIWHRMGDVGWLDAGGRLWFCGRKAHRVQTRETTLFTIPCEAVFNAHPHVARSALVGVGPPGNQEPVIVVEPMAGKYPRGRRALDFSGELLDLARSTELTGKITRFLFRRSFPVDARHNTKIDREALAKWAARRIS